MYHFAILFQILLSWNLFHRYNAEVQQNGSCPILGMLPFGHDHAGPPHPYDPWTPELVAWRSFSYLAAAQLAMDHFNARDPSVVPELADLGECNVYFPTPKFVSVLYDANAGVEALIRAMATSDDQENPLCAVLGPAIAVPATSVQTVTVALRIPQLVFFSEDGALYRKPIGNTVGVSNTPQIRARAMVEYLQNTMHADSLAVIYQVGSESSLLASALKDVAASKHNDFLVETFQDIAPPAGTTLEDYHREFLRTIKESGIKIIFINPLGQDYLDWISEALESAGMLSNDYVYILATHLTPTDSVDRVFGSLPPDSAIYKLLNGAMVFDTMDLFRIDPDEDKFLKAWKNLNATFVDRCNALIPLQPSGTPYGQADSDFFQSEIPANFASFVYDAIMLVGFGACNEQQIKATFVPTSIGNDTTTTSNGNGNHGGPPNGNDTHGGRPPTKAANQEFQSAGQTGNVHGNQGLTPQDHAAQGMIGHPRVSPDTQGMIDSVFYGASGVISFEPGVATRKLEDFTMGLYNIRPLENNETIFEAVLTQWWTSNTSWQTVEGSQFLYRDGTSNVPVTTRAVEENYLSTTVRTLGLTFFLTAFLIGAGSIVAVWWMRKDALVRRSQPIFLVLLGLGSVIMSLAIVSLSFDEGAGWTHKQLDAACMMTPWFFFLGQIMTFAALFTKLWRTDKVLQFRRRAVTVKSVMGPLVVLLMITLVILVTWTSVDPWTWEREWVTQVPAETYGRCACNHFWAFFGPLMGLLVVSECGAAFYAWKTSDVPDDFSETSAVIQAICMQLQAWVVGVPILAVLQNSSAEATYFGRVLLIWIFSISSVAVVVCPKIYRAVYLRRHPPKRSMGRVSISGVFQKKSSFDQGSTLAFSQPSSKASSHKDSPAPDRGPFTSTSQRVPEPVQKSTSFLDQLPESKEVVQLKDELNVPSVRFDV